MVNSQDILTQAKELYQAAGRQYRDQLLKTGLLLHEFIILRLQEGDSLRPSLRVQKRLTRRYVLKEAADALRTDTKRIGSLIGAAMVAKLLTDGNLGTFGHSVLSHLKVFLHRPHVSKGGGGGVRRKEIPFSIQEEWQVKPKYSQSARDLVKRAIDEDWGQFRVMVEMRNLYEPCGKSRRGRLPLKAQSAIKELRQSVKHASPGDVAAICTDLIENCEDPNAVAVRLRVLLERFMNKKKAM